MAEAAATFPDTLVQEWLKCGLRARGCSKNPRRWRHSAIQTREAETSSVDNLLVGAGGDTCSYEHERSASAAIMLDRPLFVLLLSSDLAMVLLRKGLGGSFCVPQKGRGALCPWLFSVTRTFSVTRKGRFPRRAATDYRSFPPAFLLVLVSSL